jgi:hypothetical protein
VCANAAGRIDFAAINRAALKRLPDILARWLPGGRREGREYVVGNPKRHDQLPGSFKINRDTGRWADFATGDKGGDPISLAGCNLVEAAWRPAVMWGSQPVADDGLFTPLSGAGRRGLSGFRRL